MSWQKCMFTHIYKSALKNNVTIYKCIALISFFCSAIDFKIMLKNQAIMLNVAYMLILCSTSPVFNALGQMPTSF